MQYLIRIDPNLNVKASDVSQASFLPPLHVQCLTLQKTTVMSTRGLSGGLAEEGVSFVRTSEIRTHASWTHLGDT